MNFNCRSKHIDNQFMDNLMADCNKNAYTALQNYIHPDKNSDCEQEATGKSQYLNDVLKNSCEKRERGGKLIRKDPNLETLRNQIKQYIEEKESGEYKAQPPPRPAPQPAPAPAPRAPPQPAPAPRASPPPRPSTPPSPPPRAPPHPSPHPSPPPHAPRPPPSSGLMNHFLINVIGPLVNRDADFVNKTTEWCSRIALDFVKKLDLMYDSNSEQIKEIGDKMASIRDKVQAIFDAFENAPYEIISDETYIRIHHVLPMLLININSSIQQAEEIYREQVELEDAQRRARAAEDHKESQRRAYEELKRQHLEELEYGRLPRAPVYLKPRIPSYARDLPPEQLRARGFDVPEEKPKPRFKLEPVLGRF